MDFLSIVGVILGFAVIIGGILFAAIVYPVCTVTYGSGNALDQLKYLVVGCYVTRS